MLLRSSHKSWFGEVIQEQGKEPKKLNMGFFEGSTFQQSKRRESGFAKYSGRAVLPVQFLSSMSRAKPLLQRHLKLPIVFLHLP